MGTWSYRDYYQKKKKILSLKRKRKYRADPRYRAKAIARAQKYYDDTLRVSIQASRKVVVGRNGERFLTVGGLADEIKRAPFTVRKYHWEGVIPEAAFVDKRGWRLYGQKQVDVIRLAFKKLDDGELHSLEELTKFLKENWKKGRKAA